MKIVLFAVVAMSATAFADSYVCTNKERDIRVRANDSLMVLSRPSVRTSGLKTIATFKAEDDVLSVTGRVDRGTGKKYVGDVDLRRIGTKRQGELILETKLGEVDTVKLTVKELADETLDGVVYLTKRNGETTWAPVDCE
jgi:hypothetical protein